MKITIKEIVTKKMPYQTWDNWYWDVKGDLHIEIMEGLPRDQFMLMAIHAFIESVLCRNHGVSDKDVTKFDIEFAKTAKNLDDEPGDSPIAPYDEEHNIAMAVERIMTAAMHINWKEHNRILDECFVENFKGE